MCVKFCIVKHVKRVQSDVNHFTHISTFISYLNSLSFAIRFHMLLPLRFHLNFTCKCSVNGFRISRASSQNLTCILSVNDRRILPATSHSFHLCFTGKFIVNSLQISHATFACCKYCKFAVLSSAHCMLCKHIFGFLFLVCKISQATSLTGKSTSGL